jgi:hypothetical protein
LGLGPWGKQATGPARENNKRGSKGEEGRGGGRPSRREGDREGVAHRVRAAGDTVDASVRGVRGDGARRGKGHQSQASAEGAVGQGGASDSEARHWPGRRGDGLGHPEWERSCWFVGPARGPLDSVQAAPRGMWVTPRRQFMYLQRKGRQGTGQSFGKWGIRDGRGGGGRGWPIAIGRGSAASASAVVAHTLGINATVWREKIRDIKSIRDKSKRI